MKVHLLVYIKLAIVEKIEEEKEKRNLLIKLIEDVLIMIENHYSSKDIIIYSYS